MNHEPNFKYFLIPSKSKRCPPNICDVSLYLPCTQGLGLKLSCIVFHISCRYKS
jgi:hypothetical protein